jgi:hypothetical protein
VREENTMKTRMVVLAGMLLGAGVGCANSGLRPDVTFDESRFETIFDGKSMEGWEIIIEEGHPLHDDAFYIEDGTLACKGYGWHWFRYTEPVADCVLRLEFKIAKDTNSGVCLRSLEQGAPPFTGFEVQIVDDVGADPTKHGTGSIYDIVTPMYNVVRPPGEWNDMEIVVDGLLVRVTINGRKVIDTDFSRLTEPIGKFDFAYADMPREGYIALQDHWTPIWYRNIRLLRLP